MMETVLMKILFEQQGLLMAVVMGSKFLPEVTLKKLTIKANAFSSAAKSAIESKGGACEVVSKPASSGDE
jgi:ribosomal protein L18E